MMPNRQPTRLPACVIFNPMAGKRRAQGQLLDLQRRYADRAEFWPTAQPGHAVELARQAADAGFAIVAAAGGDGTVHEVANGLLSSAYCDRTLFAVVPIGSANDYAFTFQREQVAGPRWVDVGLIEADEHKTHFVECLGIGFSGSVTAESRAIRHGRGHWLYALATLQALGRRFRHLDLIVNLDDQPSFELSSLMLSVMVGQREGGFVMTPQARLDDGLFDLLLAGNLSRLGVLHLLARLALGRLPANHPQLKMLQCQRLVVRSRQPMAIHADGELLCQESDGVTKVAITLLPKRLRVQLGL